MLTVVESSTRMAGNGRSEKDDAATASERLLCACDGGFVSGRAGADVRVIPQLGSETGLRSRGLFVLKCLVKWKEVREEMPSQLSSQLGIVSGGVKWFEEDRVICLKVLPN